MSFDREFSRRGFIVGVAAAGGGLMILPKQAGAFAEVVQVGARSAGEGIASIDMTSAGEPELFLFDEDHADACRNRAAQSCEARAIVGDRVRFALDLFAAESAPAVVAGASTYSDFILLSGTAAEHGYRVLEESAQGSLVSWTIARLRPSTSCG